LLRIYKDNYLPIIVVYTNSLSEKLAEKCWEKIKNSLNNRNLEYINVLARAYKGNPKPAFGLDKLKNRTLSKIIESVSEKTSCYQSIRERIVDSYITTIDKKYKAIKKRIESCKENYQNFNYMNYKPIFFEILNIFFFNDNKIRNIEELIYKENDSKEININDEKKEKKTGFFPIGSINSCDEDDFENNILINKNTIDEKDNAINNKDNFKEGFKVNDQIKDINTNSNFVDDQDNENDNLIDKNKDDEKDNNNLKVKINNFLNEINENFRNIYKRNIIEIY